MIHGIYIKSKPKNKWHLFSIALTAEAATSEVNEALKKAKKEGNEQAEAAIQIFDSILFIPELLSEIKSVKLLYN